MKRARQKPAEVAVRQSDRDTSFGWAAVIIFTVALAVRLLHVWQIYDAPFFSLLMGDARGYDDWAQRIARGEWLGREVFYQAPLYPYFLGVIYAVAGHHLLMARVCQAVIGSAACVLLGLTAWRMFSKPAGLVAGLGLALYAPAIFFDGLIQKSVLDVFFVCLIMWIAAGIIDRTGRGEEHGNRPGSWFWLGLATGGLSLTRENALVFVVVITAWAVRKGWGRSLLFVAGIALVLLPVAIRNHAVGGGFYLTTSQFGPNFYIGNNSRADGTYRSLRTGRGAPEFERQDATDLAEEATGHTLSPGEVSSYWTKRALGFIAEDPGAWLKLLGRKVVLLVSSTEMIDTESQETYAEWSTPLRIGGWFGHFGILVPLALFGAWAIWPERRRVWVYYAMTAAYAASLLLFYIFARYRYPLVPLLMLFASAGIVSAAAFVRASSFQQRLGIGAAVLTALVVTNWPIVPKGMPEAVTENNLGVMLRADGRVDEAMTHYRRAVAFNAAYAPAHYNLGVELYAKGDYGNADVSFREFIRLRPDDPSGHRGSADALRRLTKLDEAVREYREAIRLGTGDASVFHSLGLTLAAEDKEGEAIEPFTRAVALQPDNAAYRQNLGNALAAVGRLDEAIANYRRALELAPNDVGVLSALGLTLAVQGKMDEALASFERAVKLDPDNARTRLDFQAAMQHAARRRRPG